MLYFGDWNRSGAREGFGVEISLGEAIYEGEFKNDKRHGEGRLIFGQVNG